MWHAPFRCAMSTSIFSMTKPTTPQRGTTTTPPHFHPTFHQCRQTTMTHGRGAPMDNEHLQTQDGPPTHGLRRLPTYEQWAPTDNDDPPPYPWTMSTHRQRAPTDNDDPWHGNTYVTTARHIIHDDPPPATLSTSPQRMEKTTWHLPQCLVAITPPANHCDVTPLPRPPMALDSPGIVWPMCADVRPMGMHVQPHTPC